MAGGGEYSFLSESQSQLCCIRTHARPRVRRQRSPHHGQVVSPPDELPAVLRAENESLACSGVGVGVGVVRACVKKRAGPGWGEAGGLGLRLGLGLG
eukprot:scaffold14513_cov31-Phaeocystis_antarctica.AAC.2